MTLRQWGLLLILAPIFATTFSFYRLLAPRVPALTAMDGRMFIAMLVLGLAVAVQGVPVWPALRRWRLLLLVAWLTGAVPFVLYALGTARVSGGMAAIFNASCPVFTVIFTWAMGGERPGWQRVAGMVLGLVGVAVLIGFDAMRGGSWRDIGADGLCIAGTMAYGLGTILAGRVVGVHPTVVALAQAVGSFLVLLPLMLLVDQPWTRPMPDATAWEAMLGVALISTAAGNLLFFALVKNAGSTNTILVLFLVPVWAVIYGALFMGEHVNGHAWIGAGLIFLALAAIDGRVLRWAGARLGLD